MTERGPAPPQGYRLGWTFVVLSVVYALAGVPEAIDRSLGLVNGIELAVISVLGFAAAVRRPWSWHLLLAGLLLNMLTWSSYATWAAFEALWPPDPDLIIGALFASGGTLWHALWFGYFYRRRVAFGAQRQWRWVEQSFPRFARAQANVWPGLVVPGGPRLFISAAEFRGVFGLSRRGSVFVALAFSLLVLMLYLAIMDNFVKVDRRSSPPIQREQIR